MFSLLTSLFHLVASTQAYSVGDVNPRALQGVWRLTSLDKDGLPFEKRRRLLSSTDPTHLWKSSGFQPMKEFTTFPKKRQTVLPPKKKQTELFIKLKDDMTFEQCSSLLYQESDEKSFEEMLSADISRRERESFALKGTWDFVDGKLILASDRPEKKPFTAYYEENNDGWSSDADTILVGKVSVSSEEHVDYPIVEEVQIAPENKMGTSEEVTAASSAQKQSVDVHLSVPKGKIKTGKFMYPKHHPSFFEQPIFNPQSMGIFELQQVAADHKANEEEVEQIELFHKEDLAGKKFYLSTFPTPARKKFDRRGRIIEEDDETKLTKNLQVVALEFFKNNTFTTICGLGSSEVRRGKWSIIGEKRDQVWIQVYRFGFGRSVSYGTFSEGLSLTQDDERTYWGKITELENEDRTRKKIEVEGAIMLGTGLEPCSIGRFRMIEMEEEIYDVDEEGDDDLDENSQRFDSFFGDDVLGFGSTFDFPSGSFE